MERPDDIRAATAAELEALAAETGDGAFRAAANVLRGGRVGRPKIDDRRALSMVDGMVKHGLAKSAHEACHVVAMLTAPAHRVDSTRDRLRRKYRTKCRAKVMSDDFKPFADYIRCSETRS